MAEQVEDLEHIINIKANTPNLYRTFEKHQNSMECKFNYEEFKKEFLTMLRKF